MYLNEALSTVLKAINSFDFNLVQVLIDRVDDPFVNHVVVMWASSFKIYYYYYCDNDQKSIKIF